VKLKPPSNTIVASSPVNSLSFDIPLTDHGIKFTNGSLQTRGNHFVDAKTFFDNKMSFQNTNTNLKVLAFPFPSSPSFYYKSDY